MCQFHIIVASLLKCDIHLVNLALKPLNLPHVLTVALCCLLLLLATAVIVILESALMCLAHAYLDLVNEYLQFRPQLRVFSHH